MRFITKKWLAWLLPTLLVASGACYLAATQDVQASTVIAAPAPQSTSVAVEPFKAPVRMQIVTADLNLTVKKGTFDARTYQWTINDSDAFFAEGTATPLIYGHNRPGIFAPLSHIQKGSVLELTYADGSTGSYVYYATRFVSPDDASVLKETNPQTVMLLTCSGLFNDSRRIVYFRETQ